MRYSYILSSLLWCLWSSSLVGAVVLPRDDAVTAPECSSTCLSTYIPRFCNSTSNLTCICTNANLTAAISLCAYQSCNTAELLQLQQYSAVSCGVKNDRSRLNMVLHVDYIIPVLTALFLGGRIIGRIYLGVGLGIDDWTIIAAFVAYAASVGCSLGLVLNGFGQHTFWLSELQIATALKFFYVTELFYILTNTLSKLSLLFFLRIFPSPTLRLRVTIFSLFVLLSNLAIFLALAFQCVPFSGYWTNWSLPSSSPLRTKCINQYAALYAASGLSIAQNLVILALPMGTLWKLELSRGRRVNVLVMFSVGGGVVIFSFLRLPSLGRLRGGSDLSYEQAPIGVYSHLEQSFGIICACLPACRSLLEYFFPALRIKLSGSDSPPNTPSPSHLKFGHSTTSRTGVGRSRRNTSSRSLVELHERGGCGDEEGKEGREVNLSEMLGGGARGSCLSVVGAVGANWAKGDDQTDLEAQDSRSDEEKSIRAEKSRDGAESRVSQREKRKGGGGSMSEGVIVMTRTVELSSESVEDLQARERERGSRSPGMAM